MGFFDLFKSPKPGPSEKKGRLGIDELAERLGVPAADLSSVKIAYHRFKVPKRSGGGHRTIDAPDLPLKALQRTINRRLLALLLSHPAAAGFERGRSIVTHAAHHVGSAVLVRMDIQDFFANTKAWRVDKYFRAVGWNGAAAKLLTKLCTHKGSLPQGAPTSPRLSNLLNYKIDARLTGLAYRYRATYTRYADDLTFSFKSDDRDAVHAVIGLTKLTLLEHDYRIHHHRKLHIRRRHDRQTVTGLVVNERVNLPRRTRRWLRAVEHRARTGGQPTLSPQQLAGWRALAAMVEAQRTTTEPH